MQRNIININPEDIGRWEIPSNCNHVIVEITEATKDKRTKGGIYLGFDDDVTHAEGDRSHEAEVAEVWGYVAAVPRGLYFDKRDPLSMPWDTEVEVQVGDKVWFNYFASVNCNVMVCGDRRFFVIPYNELTVAKRGERIITLNGYCLCEAIRKDYSNDLAKGVVEHYEKDKVVIRHLGRPNKAYFSGSVDMKTYHSDNIDVQEGDTVLLRKGLPLVKLENLDIIATFSDKPLYVIQRRYMNMVLETNKQTL